MDPVGAASLSAWTPVRVRSGSHEPLVDWALVDGPFTDAFFEQTADRAMRHPFNQVFARCTPAGVLDAARASAPGIAPTGFVFHMSRCGSTLIAQMLARLSGTVVVSEAQPLDALLALRRQAPELDDATLIGWLRGMVSALGQPRAGEKRLFVKFHAWHVLELPLLRQAFPDVPWLFVFREPRAVLRSHARIAGAEVVVGSIDPAYLGLCASDARTADADEYAARALAAFCEAAVRHAGLGHAKFVDYADLPASVFSDVLSFFGVAPTDAELECMRGIARLDTKGRGATFTAPAGQRATSPWIEQLAARWLDEPYAALRAAARGTP